MQTDHPTDNAIEQALREYGCSPTFLERFWAKVQKTDGCWLWTAGCYTCGGYGQISGSKTARSLRAHVMSWVIHNGPIPEGLCVLHKCDNPPCVNPEHLFIGTHRDNRLDALSKGRAPLGEARKQSKLTVAAVINMRERYAQGGVTEQVLADAYGVCGALVHNVIARKAWRSVP